MEEISTTRPAPSTKPAIEPKSSQLPIKPRLRSGEYWLDFGSIAGFVLGAGLVVLISSIIGEESFLEWGWRLPFFVALPLGIIGLYLRHALEETRARSPQSNQSRASFP